MESFRKRRAVFILLSLFTLKIACGQGTFNTRVDYYNQPDFSSSLLLNNDTILILTNAGDSALFNVYEASILKMDLNGNVLSKKSFRRDSLSFVIGNNILNLNNKYIIPGTSGDFHAHVFGSIYQFNSNLDTASNIIKSDTSSYTYYSNIINKGNDLYIFGASDSSCGPSGYRFILKKADTLGNILWQREYGSSCVYRSPRNFDTTHANGFILCGFEQTSPLGWGTSRLFKTDSMGNVLWTKSYGNVNTYFPTVATASTSGYVLATNEIDSTYMTSFYWTSLRLYRLNEAGDTIWTKKIGPKSQDFDPINLKLLPNNDLMICGIHRIPHYDGSGNLVSEQLYGFLCRTDSSGNVKWFNSYRANSINDSTTNNYLYDVAQSNDGGFVATGYVAPLDGTTEDVWIIKVDSLGCIIGGCGSTLGVSELSYSSFNIFPNPAQNEITIESLSTGCKYAIYDSSGRLITESIISGHRTILSIHDLAIGLYSVRLQDKEKVIFKIFIKF